MNFNLTQIPTRTPKPRNNGLTMVMDKGLSVSEAKNFLEVAGEGKVFPSEVLVFLFTKRRLRPFT